MKRCAFIYYFLLYVFIVLLDGVTKLLALRFCQSEVVFTSFFSCELAYNRGVSWSLLHSDSSVVFSLVTAVILAVVVWLVLYTRNRWRAGYPIGAEIAVLAGSTGNLVNRFVYGGVVDFLMFHYGDWTWPLFNIADIAIVCGALYMIFDSFRES